MSYTFTFTDQTVDPIGKAPITVQVGSVNSTSSPVVLTGKGAANFGRLLQENLIHLLENFASSTAPSNPTVGQLWYDAASSKLKVLVDKSPIIWQHVGGLQVTNVGDPAPSPVALGDLWYQRTGTASGILYVYTGIGRYPSGATTIGGWDQIHPSVEVHGGREEYDLVRQLVENLVGSPVSTFGSGANGKAFTYLTDFGALDNDLRSKYKALGADQNVLYSPFAGVSADRDITRQAISSTMFYFNDSGTSSDGIVAGATSGVPDIAANATIMIDGVVTSMTPHALYHRFDVEDAYIVWDQSLTLASTAGATFLFVIKQDETGQWQYDNDSAWTNFTPTSSMYIIGTISARFDDNTIFPGDKNAYMWAHAVPMIASRAKYEHLKVEPNSQDWDALLSVAKYAINRLEVPSSFVRAVSDLPFVCDGRQVHSALIGLDSQTDVRYPSAARRSNRKAGTVTMVSNFAETVNALNTANTNKFSLRGINGATGTNTTFGSSISINSHVTSATPGFSNIISSGSGDLRVAFRFSSMTDLNGFLGSGGALQVELAHTGGATTADTNLRACLTSAGVWRFTADKTRIFGQSLPLTITQPISHSGLWNANSAGFLLGTVTISSVTISFYAYRVSNTQVDLYVTLNAGGTLAGTTTVDIKTITDNETYAGSNFVYSRPQAFVLSDLINSL